MYVIGELTEWNETEGFRELSCSFQGKRRVSDDDDNGVLTRMCRKQPMSIRMSRVVSVVALVVAFVVLENESPISSDVCE